MRLKFFAALMLLASPVTATAGEVSFERDVLPVLTRAGCNAGACHGNLNGKGGLKLSLKGEDITGDYAALTRDMLARRADPIRPDESLLLKKATAQVPHEGGARFARSSGEYAILRDWVSRGCRQDTPGGPALAKLVVAPASKILVDPADRFRVTAVAHFSDGTARDVARGQVRHRDAGGVLPGGALPAAAESKKLLAYLAVLPDRRAAWEDVLWALLSSKEFLLRR